MLTNQVLLFVLSMLIPVLSGFFAVSLTDRELALRFRVVFAVPLGFGVHSILYFIYKCLNVYDFSKFRIFEYAFVIVLALLYYNQERPQLSKHKFFGMNKWFFVLKVFAISIFLQYFLCNPMGHWDGFRIWNTKAQFLTVQTPQWQNVFNLSSYLSHCDYPLFLPSSVARIWMYQGGENYFSNIVLGAIMTFAVVYLLYHALSYFKNERIALAAASLLMISDVFLHNGAGQCADVPLSLFFLCAIVCVFLYFKSQRISTLVLGLIFAGLSTWVKNEGLMFLLIYSATLFGYFAFKKDWKQVCTVAGVFSIFISFAMWFKSLIPFQNDLVYGLVHAKSYLFAFDLNRYIVIFKSLIKYIFTEFGMFLLLLVLGLKGLKVKEKIRIPYLLVCVMIALTALGYLVVYVVSPHDINWIVENSLVRIMLQILPIILLIFSLALRIGKPDTLN